MTYFLANGNTFRVSAHAAIDIQNSLPVGTYTVKYDERAGEYFLEAIESLSIPSGKIYGDTLAQADRILNTFVERDNSTGVMLSGEKGSGKTLLAKLISVKAREQLGVPTVVINQPHRGEEFNRFVQMIDQPTVIIFDEFEKTYNYEQQEALLTLLDGVYPSKKMFILTSNDKRRVSSHLSNRPGRIYYSLDYRGLENEFIHEYCEDNLKNKSHIETIQRIASVFGEFNFDILKAVVEEMNRYDESPQQVMKILNAKPEFSEGAMYKMEFSGAPLDKDDSPASQWAGNPFAGIELEVYNRVNGYREMRFMSSDLMSIDAKTGKFSFRNDEGIILTLTRQKSANSGMYWDAF